MSIETLIPGVDRLPDDSCPVPVTATVAEATSEVLAAAAAQGLMITDHTTGMLHVLPPFDDSVAEAAKIMGVWCRRVELANWLAGYERHRWWNVVVAGRGN
jgi:hypothetical protein